MEAVAFSGDDFWGHVVGGAYDGIGSEPALDFQFFGGAHVDQREEAVGVHHEIFGFEVSVDDAVGVQVLHHEQDLGDQLSGVVCGEGDHFGDDVEEVFPLDELHDEVDEVAVFYQLVEGDHEGEARHCPQDLLLVHDVLDYLRLLDVGTVQHLYRVYPLGLRVPAGVDLAEVALPQLAHHVEVRNLHLFLKGCPVFFPALLSLHPYRHWRGGYFHFVQQFPEDAVVGGDHVFFYFDVFALEQLGEFDDGVGFVGGGGAFEVGIEQDVDAALVVAASLEDGFSFFEGEELAGVGCGFESVGVECVCELAFAEDFPHDVAFDDVFEAVAEASFDVLAAHGDDHAAGLGDEGVGPDAAFDEDGVFAEAVHFFEFVVLLLDEDGAFLDDVEGVGVVALVEDDLSLLVGLGEAGGGERVLLLLGELLEEGEHVEELLVLLLVLLVDLLHHLQEDPPVYLRQLAVGQREH